MRRILAAALVATMVVAVPAQSQQVGADQPSVQLPPDLDRVLRDYETRFRIGGDTLAALFTPDGYVLPSGQPPVRGRANIAGFYSRAGGPLVLRAIAYGTEGNVGYILGGYTYGDATTDIGKLTLTLRKDSNGRWLIFSDMDNSNRRP